MDLALITSILAVTIRAGTSLVFATIGEIYTERSGVLNLGLEGTMLMGAVSGLAAAYHTEGRGWVVIVAMVVGRLHRSGGSARRTPVGRARPSRGTRSDKLLQSR